MTIELTPSEIHLAAIAGVMRQILNLRRPNAHRFDGDGWGAHIDGCLAELVVAKATNTYWDAVVRDFRALEGDVGKLQVRSTTRSNGSLILHDGRDKDNNIFVLVTSAIPIFTIRGAIWGCEGKQAKYWRDDVREPAYFVPQSDLRTLESCLHELEPA